MPSIRTRAAASVAAGALAVAGLFVAPVAANAAPPSTPHACGNSSLKVTATEEDGGAGHGSFLLLFHNVAAHACTITGYPGLDAIKKSGHLLAHAKRTPSGYAGGPGQVRTILVKRNGFANATVEWLNFNPKTSGDCPFSASVEVTPANTADTVSLPVSVSKCQLQVHPTAAGTNGNKEFALAQVWWIKGANAVSADQDRYFNHALKHLKVHPNAYSTEIKALKQLISLPETGLTHKQRKEARKDLKELDGFFVTPGLYT